MNIIPMKIMTFGQLFKSKKLNNNDDDNNEKKIKRTKLALDNFDLVIKSEQEKLEQYIIAGYNLNSKEVLTSKNIISKLLSTRQKLIDRLYTISGQRVKSLQIEKSAINNPTNVFSPQNYNISKKEENLCKKNINPNNDYSDLYLLMYGNKISNKRK